MRKRKRKKKKKSRKKKTRTRCPLRRSESLVRTKDRWLGILQRMKSWRRGGGGATLWFIACHSTHVHNRCHSQAHLKSIWTLDYDMVPERAIVQLHDAPFRNFLCNYEHLHAVVRLQLDKTVTAVICGTASNLFLRLILCQDHQYY